jgi:S1-C subfamily serine protease
LLGIATAGLSRIAGLAIPAATVDRVVDALLEKGHVPSAYLGIGIQPVAIPDSLRTDLSLPNRSGVMVVSVEPDGPADRAGVFLGDILVSLGEEQTKQIEDLQSVLESLGVGKTVKARLIRAGVLQEVTVTLDERPGK